MVRLIPLPLGTGGSVGGTGTPGGSNTQVQYNDGGAFAGASNLIYDKVNNRIGVGTAAPTERLDLYDGSSNGAIRIGLHQNLTPGVGTIEYDGTNFRGYGPGGWVDLDSASQDQLDPGIAAGQMAFWNGSKWTYTETSELFWDDTNKRVGIGTSSPLNKLEVLHTVANPGRFTRSSSDTNVVRNALVLRHLTSGTMADGFGPLIEFQIADGVADHPVGSIGIVRDGHDDSGAMVFETKYEGSVWTERMRLTSTGRLGIGASSPSYPVDVRAASNAHGSVQSMLQLLENNIAYNAGPKAGMIFSGLFNSVSGVAAFSGVQGEKENAIDGDYASALTFHTRINGGNLTEKIRITSTGYVGIGTTTPQAKLDINGDVHVGGNLVVVGSSSVIESETVLIADSQLYLNSGYTVAAGMAGGLVVNYLPTATTDTVAAGGFTAGVPATSNPTVATVGAAVFSVGDLIQISDANNPANDGLYEVLSHAANLLTIRGIGLTGAVETFTQNQFATDTTVAGSIYRVTVSIMRAGVDGLWETGKGSATGITFTDIGGVVAPLDSGTAAGQMAFWTGSKWTYTETSELYWDDTNKRIGINTTGPDRRLDILDSSNPQLRLTHTDGSVYTDFQTDSNGQLIINSTSGRLRINNNLGVGAAPSDSFTIYASSYKLNTSDQIGIRSDVERSVNSSSAYYNLGTHITIKEDVANSITNSGYILAGGFEAYLTGSGTISDVMGLRVDVGTKINPGIITNTEGIYIRILNQGSGTITNSRGIVISSNKYSGTITNCYGIAIDALSGTNTWGIFQSGANDKNYFAGNVGIGTTTPATALQVNGTVTATVFASGSPFIMKTGSTERVRIDDITGNVGIGTASPSSNLHITNAGADLSINLRTHSNVTTTTNYLAMFKSGGTEASPTATQMNDYLGIFGFGGYHGTGGYLLSAQIVARARQAYTGTARGSALHIQTTPNDTTAPVTRIFVENDGNVGINTTGPDRRLDVLDASNPQLRLTHTDGSVYTDFQTDSSGYLSVTTSGGKISLGSVTSVFNSYIQLSPHNTGAGNTTEIRFLELAANGTNYVGFKSPDAIAANKIWVLPNADGTTGQVLKTDGSGNLGWVTSSGGVDAGTAAGQMLFWNGTSWAYTETSELFWDDTNKKIGIGTPIDDPNNGGLTLLQSGAGSVKSWLTQYHFSNDTDSPGIYMYKARGTKASKAVVQSGDYLGVLYFGAYDGSVWQPAASIECFVDGTPGINDMPTGFRFLTTSNGSAANTERMRINNSGSVGINTILDDAFNGGLTLLDTGSSYYMSWLTQYRHSSDDESPGMWVGKSRGTKASKTIVQNGDKLFVLNINAWDGASYNGAAAITARVTGTPGTNDMPTSLLFHTCSDGAADVTERMRITHEANFGFNTTNQFGSGAGVFGIKNAGTNPSTNPTSGGVLYADAGAGKWRGSSGTVTTFGPAEPHCPVCDNDYMHEWENESKGTYLAVCMNCLAEEIGSRPWILRKKAA